jgi:ATP adenylyltransferase
MININNEKSLTTHRQFQFIIAGILNKKPILAANAPSRSKAGGPFVNPDPEEVVTDLGSTHRLLVNKYGIFRPMTVLPTKHYALQTDDLDLSDVNAAWSVLKAFETPSLIIYNCGINAGSSQGHKHTQVFPLPAHPLWPSKATSCDGKATSSPLLLTLRTNLPSYLRQHRACAFQALCCSSSMPR